VVCRGAVGYHGGHSPQQAVAIVEQRPRGCKGHGIIMVDILKEFWLFLRERKKYWLLPIVLVLGLLGGLIVLTQGSAIAPFIYTLF